MCFTTSGKGQATRWAGYLAPETSATMVIDKVRDTKMMMNTLMLNLSTSIY